MNRLLLALSAVAVMGLVSLGTALAHGPGPVRAPSGRTVSVSSKTSAELLIVHIVKGCHSWTNGKIVAEQALVKLRRGGRLTILNQDVDLHRLVQLQGPRVATGGRMMMNASVKLRFSKAGLYRFKTVTSEMPGMPEMKTIGPDYRLVLRVRVT